MRKQKNKIIIFVFICVLVLSGYGLNFVKNNYRAELLGSSIVHRLIPLYRSLRKLPDIVFMPWSAFATTNLETYELSISPKNIERMNAALPDSPFHSSLDADARVWVSAYFRTAGYEGNVKIRYRGNLPAHWNAYQKSYVIKFPKDALFEGKKKINLVIPSDRRYLDMPFNSYRAEKLGLIHPDETLVRTEINGADTGVLLAFESWSQPWIEKMPISPLSTLYGVDDSLNIPGATYQDRWMSWNSDEPVDFEPLEILQELINHAPDDVFERLIPQLIDIEDWYAWDTMRILATGYHGDSGNAFGANNLVLIFDRTEGRFKPVPYNTIIYTPSHRALSGHPGIAGAPPQLFQRILSIPTFRARRDEVFYEYVRTEKEADLQFLEDWKNTYNREFLLDNAKNANHFMYLAKIKESVQAIEEHFDDPFNMLEVMYAPSVEITDELIFPESFKHLAAAGADPFTASKQHSSLRFIEGNITIPAGTHTFPDTIIIPAHTQLTIQPGTTLRMGEDASFISYSPVIAEGAKYQPITIKGKTDTTDWGVFAIINTGKAASSLAYVRAESGGTATINGAVISGTIAFHNADGIIASSSVTGARGDDGINVKGGKITILNTDISNNSSDGIDLDYVHEESIFSHNTLVDNAGDAIDISWSDLTISHNTILTCADKGISVGEKSNPTITNNLIIGCAIGIAIKDSSIATATKNTIVDTGTVFSLYKKKPYFGGGTLIASENNLLSNKKLLFTDDLSTATLSNNSTTTTLNFDAVPPSLYTEIKTYVQNLGNWST